jgi:hypothetical protein
MFAEVHPYLDEPRFGGTTDDGVPIVLRDTPPGCNWGFYSEEEPRMHLQVLRGPFACKVWFESEGKWVIERSKDAPAKLFNVLRQTLEQHPLIASRIRAEWVHQIYTKAWLQLRVSGDRAILTAYPGTHHAFERVIDLSAHARPSLFVNSDQDVDIDEETVSLVIGARRPEHEWVMVNLADVLWEDVK